MLANHPISAWIDGRLTQAEFARSIGCSPSHLSLVLKDERGMSFDLARRVSMATGGAIQIESLLARKTRKRQVQEAAA